MTQARLVRVPLWKVELRWVILIFSSGGGWRGFIFLFDYFWHFCQRLSRNPETGSFCPPPPLQGKGHSGECNSLLHVKQADEWPARAAEWKGYLARPRAREKGGGAFRASRATIIPSPFSCFPVLSNACHARRLAEGSPFKMWFPIVLQNSLTYKQKFRNHVFSAHPLAALV